MDTNYQLLPELFLRAPFYSFASYDLDWLPEVLAEECFRNAIWLASPGFYRVLEAKGFAFERLNEKERFTLAKYYNRMCFRPTPFGSFASFTILKGEESAPVRLADTSRSVLHLLPDLQFLTARQMFSAKEMPETLLSINPTLYRFGPEFRFVKSAAGENGRLCFSLEAVAAESLVIQLVGKFKKGNMTAGAFEAWMQSKTGCATAIVQDYLDFLLNEQVLFPALCMGMIRGNDGDYSENTTDLARFWAHHQHIPLLKIGALADKTADLHILSGISEKSVQEQCFYAALERPADAGGLCPSDKEDLLAAVHVLQKLSVSSAPPALEKFISDFTKRFDQEKVPLLFAVDPDAGISYANLLTGPGDGGLLKNIPFPDSPTKPPDVNWTDVHRLLFSLLAIARRANKYEQVNLLPEDLQIIRPRQSTASPATQAIMFRKTEEYLQIEYCGGAAATSLVGRFSLFNNEAAAFCRKLATIESHANPGVVFADIDQRSNTHVDNINRREKIYDFYIPVNSYADPSCPGRIALEDLLLSVQGGQLVLESKRLSKRVIPRLATAFNYYHNGLALFRLLCDLQFQGLSTLETLDLERFFPGMDFYPRVVTGQVILCTAKWKIGEPALSRLSDNRGESVARHIRDFRRESGVPAKVSIGRADQQLVFDLASEPEAALFLQSLKGLKTVTLHEYLPPSREVKTGKNPLAAQFIAFLSHTMPIYQPTPASRPGKKKERSFMIGSEWLYLKLFCTPEASDRLLTQVVRRFVREQKINIRRWFFIRYDENGHHLRLRFNAEPGQLSGLLVAFRKILVKTGTELLVRDCIGDTYRRELERYGQELISIAEDVFCAGSEIVCEYLASSPYNAAELARLRLAVLTAYQMIICFMPEQDIQLAFTGMMADRFTEEFGGGKSLKIELDLKYRAVRGLVFQQVTPTAVQGLSPDVSQKFRILLLQTRALVSAAKKLEHVNIQGLLADLVHMQMNRAFRANQRQQELLVYFCLHKSIKSLIAQLNKVVIP